MRKEIIKQIYDDFLMMVIDDINSMVTTNVCYCKNYIDSIRAEIFNIMLVISGYRKGMLVECCKRHSLIGHTINILKKYNIKSTGYIQHHKDTDIDIIGSNEDNRSIGVIFNNRNRKLAEKAISEKSILSSYSIGQLLEFCCSDDHHKYDRAICQHIYADGYEFYTQVCTMSNYQKNENTMKYQLKRYQKLGKILNIDITMKFIKFPSPIQILNDIKINGIKGVFRNKSYILCLLDAYEHDLIVKNVISLLESTNYDDIKNNNVIICSTINDFFQKYFDIPSDVMLQNKYGISTHLKKVIYAR
jgi:hypothetical protein